jgi:hypothetical protein
MASRMSPLSLASLNGVELEPRLVAHAAWADGLRPLVALTAIGSTSEAGPTTPDDRGAGLLAGVSAEQRGGQILLTVRMAESCPGCSLRLAGVTRAVGDGITNALFRLPLGARSAVVEMTDSRGQFVPVARVELSPDGRVVRSTAESDADDGDDESADGHDSAMAMVMPMSAGGADMALHAGGDFGGGPPMVTHDRMSVRHEPGAMTGHAGDMPHRWWTGAGGGPSADHMAPGSAPSTDGPGSSHAADDADPFRDESGPVWGMPSGDGHDLAARSWLVRPPHSTEQVDEDDADPVPEVVDPVDPVSAKSAADSGDPAQPAIDPGESAWPIAAGGTAAAATLFAASHALEQRSRKLAALATLPPERRPRAA